MWVFLAYHGREACKYGGYNGRTVHRVIKDVNLSRVLFSVE